ncbi:uncharacterized protein LOC122507198 [Leptopilina heterotoma]|uniref:uncharacterized protein LOC122507198 n=1 Tax=Leptopilina heterotoma TaxID=63436 RepID=UPI001CA8878E|nr:uncharacterized protein LOC122507198 [Leptopilina heterotoma]
MVGKWTLQLLGTVLMFIVGIFNFHKEEIPLTENSGLKKITLMNDRINMDFREQLKITIKYFGRLLNHYKCNKRNLLTGTVIYMFRKILILTCESAEDIYLYNRLHNYSADNLIPSRIDEIKNGMPLECGRQPERLKEIYQNIYRFLNLYYKNFPKEENDIEYNTCYVVSLLEFATLNAAFVTYNYSISALKDKIMKCIALKSQEKNSTAKYFNKKMFNTNSKIVIYHLHKEDIRFRDHLKIVTNFFKTILNHYECSKSPINVISSIEEWKIPSIIWFISISAEDNYSYHTTNASRFKSTKWLNYSSEVSKLIPQECGTQLKENKKLIQNLYQLFNMYYENFPTQFINDDFSKCFTESVKNIKDINLEEFDSFKNNSAYRRQSLIVIIKKNLVSIMKCVELKEHL